MPIIVPITGAGDGDLFVHVVPAYSAITVKVSHAYSAIEAVTIEGLTSDEGLQSVAIGKNLDRVIRSAVELGEVNTDTAIQALEVIKGDDFLILADLLAENLSGPNIGSFGYLEINAVLLVNGTPVPIKSFQYQVPTGRLGSTLSVVLADPNVALVPVGAAITFSLVVTVGGTTSYYQLINNGKLQEREYQITYQGGNAGGPKDVVSFSSLDVMNDKFSLAPRRPVVLFDPSRVRYDDVRVNPSQAVRDEHGTPILPIVEPVYGLSMKQILNRAYTSGGGFISTISGSFAWTYLIGGPGANPIGCGFTQVITNIADYLVRRADFTIEAGWHDGAQPVVAMYAPVYFVEGTRLFIIDVDKPLPFGVSPHTVSLAEHKSLSERVEYKPDANAVLLTYQYNGNDLSEDPARVSRDVFTEEVIDETGTPNEVGYSKVSVRRWDREFYMTDNPTEVLDTLPLSTNTETQQYVVFYDTDGNPVPVGQRLTHQETVDYLYEGDLKIRHIKETKVAIPDPSNNFLVSLIVAETETCEISWTEDPTRPGVKIQDRVRTDVWAVCAYDTEGSENIDYGDGAIEFTRMIPFLQAQASGVMTDTWALTLPIPIKSIRETLHHMKGQQYDVEVVETDYINNTHKRSFTQPTTGSVTNDPYEAKSRSMLIRDTVSEGIIGPRVPVPVNAYELPRIRAIELARRVLYRLNNPLMALPIVLPGVDFSIRRGSVITGQKRTGYTGNYFVTGYSISGENLGKTGHRVSQTLEATQLLPLP